MALVKVAHNPELTPQIARDVFSAHFIPKGYEVVKPKYVGPPLRFDVKKNDWIIVLVRFQQKPDETSFVVRGTGGTPVRWLIPLWITMGWIVVWLRNRKPISDLEREVIEFIKTCPEFAPETEAASG